MNKQQIQQILDQQNFPDPATNPQLAETHISWIIIGDKYAFKIKKPLELSFLDFSTLADRKYYCEEEVTLNRRLEPDLYLGVLPIKEHGKTISIGKDTQGEIIDYAVHMKKLEANKHMPYLLENNAVKEQSITALAQKVAQFHHRATTEHQNFSLQKAEDDFKDIKNVQPLLSQLESASTAQVIPESIEITQQFLQAHKAQFQHRYQEGMVKDCHGDLHSGNIFLYDPPVIFDCIEFNAAFRQIDVLNEIAFFCMDMEAWGETGFSNLFKKKYVAQHPVIQREEDEKIFTYYKCYRANVRLKVTLLQYEETSSPDNDKWQRKIEPYLHLIKKYLPDLQ